MSRTIGGNSVITMRGAAQPLVERMRGITRPGVDGSAYKKLGQRAEPFELYTMSGVTSVANARTLIETTYAALVGTLVTLVDDHNTTWNNVAVLAITSARVKKLSTIAGGTGSMTHAVFVRWEMQLTEDAQ